MMQVAPNAENPVRPTDGAACVADPPPSVGIAAASAAARMHYVDGLRALAALSVALYHYRSWVTRIMALVPGWLDAGLKRGYLGVQVFFVLSGFVISHSLRSKHFSAGLFARFALRRQLRLDPPYWIVILLSAAALARDPGLDPARISPPTLLAHFFYLQQILGYPNLLDVFWTLAIEVQLYLAFVGLAWLGQGGPPNRRRREAIFVITTLASLSLAWLMDITHWRAWFIVYWYMFALGVFTRWALDDKRARGWLALFLLLAMVRSVWFNGPSPAVCATTAILLYGAARLPSLARVLGARPLVALGRISYSFYLLHALVGGEVLTLVLRTGPPSLARDVVALVAALAAALVCAVALYGLVERPAMALSRKVRLG